MVSKGVLLGLALVASAPGSARAELPSSSPSDAPTPGVASGAYQHDGFYLRDAFGLGYSSVREQGGSGDAHLTGTNDGLVLIGGTPGRGLVLGGGAQTTSLQGNFRGGVYDGPSASAWATTLGPFVDFYPDPAGGLHVGALVGPSVAFVSGPSFATAASAGASVFGGYDWWVGPQWSLGVLAMASDAFASPLVDGHGRDTGYRVAPLSVGIAFSATYH